MFLTTMAARSRSRRRPCACRVAPIPEGSSSSSPQPWWAPIGLVMSSPAMIGDCVRVRPMAPERRRAVREPVGGGARGAAMLVPPALTAVFGSKARCAARPRARIVDAPGPPPRPIPMSFGGHERGLRHEAARPRRICGRTSVVPVIALRERIHRPGSGGARAAAGHDRGRSSASGSIWVLTSATIVSRLVGDA